MDNELHKVMMKAGELAKEYYNQDVPSPEEKDRLEWLATISPIIARDFEKTSLKDLMRNIPFLAFYVPKHVGHTYKDYLKKHMTKKEYEMYVPKQEKEKED